MIDALHDTPTKSSVIQGVAAPGTPLKTSASRGRGFVLNFSLRSVRAPREARKSRARCPARSVTSLILGDVASVDRDGFKSPGNWFLVSSVLSSLFAQIREASSQGCLDGFIPKASTFWSVGRGFNMTVDSCTLVSARSLLKNRWTARRKGKAGSVGKDILLSSESPTQTSPSPKKSSRQVHAACLTRGC